jgi:alpha-tubulin suppressor-like RCC1 family protein
VGKAHGCARRADATVWCWGSNEFGQLGDGTTTDRVAPVQARRDLTAAWTSVTAGSYHTCARDTVGRLWCWGDDSAGQRGDADGASPTEPIGVTAATIQARSVNSCAIGVDRSLWCWGDSGAGQLDVQHPFQADTPRLITAARDWTSVTVGYSFMCGIRTDARLWCWGANGLGQLGDSTREYKTRPTRLRTDAAWLTAGAGYNHVCGIQADHSLWCWGGNRSHELGLIVPARRPVPVPAG